MLGWSEWNKNYQWEVSQGQSPMCDRLTRKKIYKEYVMKSQDCCKNSLAYEDLVKAKIALEKANVPMNTFEINFSDPFSFGNCTSAPTPPQQYCFNDNCMGCDFPKQEQGNNPMRIETNSATAIVSAIKSDEAIQRDFLLQEFDRITACYRDEKPSELRKMFNLDAPKAPQSSQELLDAITSGKYTVDQAKVDANAKLYSADGSGSSYDDDENYIGSQYYGITFTDLPVADVKGYDAALEAYKKAKTDTKRKIVISSPADGLAALVALEAWMPTQNAPTTATVQ